MKRTIENKLGFVQTLAVFGDEALIYKVARVCTGHGFDAAAEGGEAVDRLIRRLYHAGHFRCFEFAGIVFGIRCPIFVERQLRTYRKPEVERSLRACDPIELLEADATSNAAQKEALERYKTMRQSDWRREEARRVLTLDTLTETASFWSLRSLLHMFDERLASSAQSETRLFAEAMREAASEAFPCTLAAWSEKRSGAV